MKTTILSLPALAASVLAQVVTQSKPFNLVTVSDTKSVNGLKLNACHSGAAIETFCTSQSYNPSQYYLNVTTYPGSTTPTPAGGQTGILGYTLPAGNIAEPESMRLEIDIATNVGIPVLFPGNTSVTYAAFDKNNYLNLQSYIDDTVSPPNATGPAKAYYRWYICETYYGSYTYQTLAWVYGNKKPENPSCIKTDVKRVFVY